MDPRRFIVPNYMMIPNYAPVIRQPGLFSRLFNGIKGVNWSNLLTNANKTLDVVNQTIPLVRQAGPMFSNMRSMFHLAKAFGNETSKKESIKKRETKESNIEPVKTNIQNDLPNFFV